MGKFFKTAQNLNKNLVSFSGNEPNLPRGPKPKPNLLAKATSPDPSAHATFNFASTEPNLPSGPTNPNPSITVDPETLLASVPGHTPDNRKDMNYYFADYALRQERGLHNPQLRPIAAARQKLKNMGFKIHTDCVGKDCKPQQVTPANTHASAAKAYSKRLKKIIESPTSRKNYVGTV